VGSDPAITAVEVVLNGPVPAVGDHGVHVPFGVCVMGIEHLGEQIPLIDGSRGHGRGGDHFALRVNCPVGLVAELGFAASLSGDRGIGVGGGKVAAVRGGGLGGFYLIESLLEASVTLIEVSLQAVRINDRVIGGVGIDEARVDKELAPVHEPCLHALLHDTFKETLKGIHSPSSPGFTEHAVVGDLAVELVAQKPQPIQALRDGVHELPLRSDIVEDQKKHELEDHWRRHGDVPLEPVGVCHLLVDELEVDCVVDLSEDVILANAFLQGEPGEKELVLQLRLATHHGDNSCEWCDAMSI